MTLQQIANTMHLSRDAVYWYVRRGSFSTAQKQCVNARLTWVVSNEEAADFMRWYREKDGRRTGERYPGIAV